MLAHLVGVLAARMAVVLCVVVVVLPYILRGDRLSRKLGFAAQSTKPYLGRLWPHFWVGYLIAGLTVLHVGMATESMGRADVTGIWAATVALLLVLFEIVLGLSLKEPKLSGRKALRQIHFWLMVSFVGTLSIHLVLNG